MGLQMIIYIEADRRSKTWNLFSKKEQLAGARQAKIRIVEEEIDNRRKTRAKLAATVADLIFSADTFSDEAKDAGNIMYVWNQYDWDQIAWENQQEERTTFKQWPKTKNKAGEFSRTC